MPPPLLPLVLLFGGTFVSAVGAGIGGHFVRRKRIRDAQAGWAAFAERNGLVGGDSTEGQPLRIWYGGARDGHSIALAGGLTLDRGWTTIRVLLDPPLDLGLVMTTGKATRIVVADDDVRANGLFDAGGVAALNALRAFNWHVNDVGVFIEEGRFLADPTELEGAVRLAVDLAREIDRARAQVPRADGLRGFDLPWSNEARRHGFVHGTTPLSMRGTIDGVPVSAFSFRADKNSYGLGAYATFSQPLQGAVGLAPTKPGELAFWLGIGEGHPGTEDWELGDPAFDRAFIVRARDPGKLAKILPPSLCAKLLRLHQRYPLVVDDCALRLAARHLPTPDLVPPLMREIAEIAAEIELNAIERKPQAGPYR